LIESWSGHGLFWIWCF